MERSHDAAGIAIIDDKRRILLVHQTYGEEHWSFPGGVVEDGESAYDAALRECREEISIHAKDIELCGVYFMSHRNGYIFTFRTSKYDGEIIVDGKEIGEYGFFGVNELPRPITNFTVERAIDAIESQKAVFKDQHVRDYKTLL